jgi:inosine-uridine nucleoside N-ribohydrolase
MVQFPKMSDDWMRQRLALPKGRVRVVIDTDTANEIDDQFALAWALLSQDQLQVEAVYAEPFSFAHRKIEMLRAKSAQRHPTASEADKELAEHYDGMLAHYAAKGWDIATLQLEAFNPPEIGMERSYQEILRVFEKMGEDANGRVFRGSAGYLPAPHQALESPAVTDLIDRTMATSDDDILYVVAIGAVTNIASALLLQPEILRKIVVVWTSGFPSTHWRTNYSLNMEEDLWASQILMHSGVPHVYLPGFHVGAQLRLSLPEMELYVKGRGAIGDYLHDLYIHNPLWEFLGISDFYAYTWVIWDVINIAWLLNPRWVASDLVRAPQLGDDRKWKASNGHLMREAYDVQRDAIFRDFFRKLEARKW